MTELTKEQSIKGNELLEKFLSNDSLERKVVYDFFNNRDEAIVICKLLEQKKLINLLGPTYNDPFMLITREDGIETFLKNGGLLKEYKNSRKKTDWYKVFGLILTLVFGFSTIYFSKKNFDLKENQSDIITKYDSLKVENNHLIKLVDSLKVENKSQLDKLKKEKLELEKPNNND